MWTEEYKRDVGWWPMQNTWGAGVTTPGGDGFYDGRWVDTMAPYAGSRGNTSWNRTPAKNYLLCPGQDYRPTVQNAGLIYRTTHISWGWRLTNYMTTSVMGYGNLTTQPKIWWPKRAEYDFGMAPARQVVLGEIYSAATHLGYYNWLPPLIYPHQTNVNLGFADGHVKGFSRTDVQQVCATTTGGPFRFR